MDAGCKDQAATQAPVESQHISDYESTISDSSDQDDHAQMELKAKTAGVAGAPRAKRSKLSISEKISLVKYSCDNQKLSKQ